MIENNFLTNALEWTSRNRDWVFSGIGVSALTLIGLFIIHTFRRRKKEINNQTINTESNSYTVSVNSNNTYNVSYDVTKEYKRFFSEEAKAKFNESLINFSTELSRNMSDHIKNNTELFNTPDLQITLREAILNYARTNDKILKIALVKCIISRLESDEESTMCKLSRQAVSNLTMLTPKQIRLISFIYFAKSSCFKFDTLEKLVEITENITTIMYQYESITWKTTEILLSNNFAYDSSVGLFGSENTIMKIFYDKNKELFESSGYSINLRLPECKLINRILPTFCRATAQLSAARYTLLSLTPMAKLVGDLILTIEFPNIPKEPLELE